MPTWMQEPKGTRQKKKFLDFCYICSLFVLFIDERRKIVSEKNFFEYKSSTATKSK